MVHCLFQPDLIRGRPGGVIYFTGMHKKPKDPEEAEEKDMLSEEVKQTNLQEVRVKFVWNSHFSNPKAKIKISVIVFTQSV